MRQISAKLRSLIIEYVESEYKNPGLYSYDGVDGKRRKSLHLSLCRMKEMKTLDRQGVGRFQLYEEICKDEGRDMQIVIETNREIGRRSERRRLIESIFGRRFEQYNGDPLSPDWKEWRTRLSEFEETHSHQETMDFLKAELSR